MRSKIRLLWRLCKMAGLFSVTRFMIYRLSKKSAVLPLTIGGVPLYLRTRSPDLSVAIDSLLNNEFAALREAAGENVTFIIDGGGYIGTAAIAMTKMFPLATIVSVEPSEDSFVMLLRNTAKFPNIVPLKAAIVGADREVSLHDRHSGEWGYTIQPTQGGKHLKPLHHVDGISIPTIMKKFGSDHIDVLKLDIEGGEMEILSHASEWLPATKSVYIELHDRIVVGCTEAFERATTGMNVARIKGEKHLAYRP
jgi:FkbM family methyltransferase